MGQINSVSGARLFIGDTALCTVLSDFQGQSWTEIGEIENLPDHGDKKTIIPFISLADARTQKLAGTSDAGDIELIVGADPTDEGQAALLAAFDVKLPWNFKVLYDDALTIGGSGTEEYYRALVTSKVRGVGTANSVLKRRFMSAITSGTIEAPAT